MIEKILKELHIDINAQRAEINREEIKKTSDKIMFSLMKPI